MISLLKTAALSLTLSTLSPALFADLVPLDYRSVGDNLLTLDSKTNLQWLDLTATVGRSWTDAATLTSSTGLFAGFRLATDVEFRALLAHAGVAETTGANSDDPSFLSATANLQSLLGFVERPINLGPLGIVGRGEYSIGDLSSTEEGFSRARARLVTYHFNPDSTFYNAEIASIPTNSFSDPIFGLYLVRGSAVPEPSTYGLIGAGCLAALAAWRRRRSAR